MNVLVPFDTLDNFLQIDRNAYVLLIILMLEKRSAHGDSISAYTVLGNSEREQSRGVAQYAVLFFILVVLCTEYDKL